MRDFLTALSFLTILPLKPVTTIDEKAFGRSLTWFGFIGAIIGMAASAPLVFSDILPQAVIAALIMAVSIIITGAIHLDGFADTCDGLCGASNKTRSLEIMRDSHIGSMATIGVAMLLIVKFSVLASMPREAMFRLIIMANAFARWAQALSCTISKYARADGKAKYFIEYASWRELFAGTAFILALFLLLSGIRGATLFCASVLPVFALVKYIESRIGGMTGDTIGAASEVSEVIVLLFGLVLCRGGV